MNEKHNSECECCMDKQTKAAKANRNSRVSMNYVVGLLKKKLNIKLN